MTDSVEFRVQRQAPVHEQVAEHLRDAITRLRLRPGQPLIERELCRMTAASRPSVREALRQLQAEGLVVTVRGRGSFVAEVSKEEALHIYEVRAVLEGLAAQAFAERASEGEHSEMHDALAEIERTVAEPDAMLAAKDHFYEVLLRGCGNPVAKQLLDQLHRRITILRATSLSAPGRPPKSVREIREIVEAIDERDGARAARLCAQHVRAAAAAALGRVATISTLDTTAPVSLRRKK